MQKIEKVLYTAKAHTLGGREGSTKTDDGRLNVTLSTPKGLGGNDGPGTNPEQLFASGYSACFIGALKFAAMNNKTTLPNDLSVDATVGIGPIPQGFGIKVDMNVHLPGMNKDQAHDLVERAHQVCPYSNATRGNIEVNLTVTT